MRHLTIHGALSIQQVLVVALFATFSFACAESVTTDATQGSEKGYETGLIYAGDTCAEGCVWSRYAVTLNAQTGEQSCVEGPCACVVEGDVYTSCEPPQVNTAEPIPELPPTSAPINQETYSAGERCAEGCVWSSYAISMGAQAPEASCHTGPCACVQDGDIYTRCAQSDPASMPSEPPVVEPEPEVEPDPETDLLPTSSPSSTGRGAPISGVPYFYQYNNTYSPGATCQNTSIAMVLGYVGWRGVPDQITARFGRRFAQSPAGLAEVFNTLSAEAGLSARLTPHTSGSVEGLKRALDQGPVIIHGMFTSAGHVLVVLGYDERGFWAHDPAGAWSQTFEGGYSGSWGAEAGRQVYYQARPFIQAISTLDGYNYTPLWYHTLSR